MNTAAYSPRPGTPAADWTDQVPAVVKEDRFVNSSPGDLLLVLCSLIHIYVLEQVASDQRAGCAACIGAITAVCRADSRCSSGGISFERPHNHLRAEPA